MPEEMTNVDLCDECLAGQFDCDVFVNGVYHKGDHIKVERLVIDYDYPDEIKCPVDECPFITEHILLALKR